MLAPPCKNKTEYPLGTFKSSFTNAIALSITATKGLLLCEISIKDKLSSLKLSTAAEACFKTSCGSMQGPAEKLCFFIIILFFLSKLLFQYQF